MKGQESVACHLPFQYSYVAPAIEGTSFITSFNLGSNVLAIFQGGRKNTKTLGSGVIWILVLLHAGSMTLGSYSAFWRPTFLLYAVRTLIETLDGKPIAQGHVSEEWCAWRIIVA